MSNIYTEHARLYFRPGMTLDGTEMESLLERILGERGSYWVPVWYENAWPSHVDFQVGSGKSAGVHNFEPEDLTAFEEIWVRFADEGSDYDVIYEWAPARQEDLFCGNRRRRTCMYAFDEVRVFLRNAPRRAWLPEGPAWKVISGGFAAKCSGRYSALNERADMEIGPCAQLGMEQSAGGFPTPSTPYYGSGRRILVQGPPQIDRLLELGQHGIDHVDLLYAGRIVHRTEWHVDEEEFRGTYWRDRCADHWDNCVDEEFVRLRKTGGK